MQCANVFNNLTFAWEGLKFGIGKDKYVAKNVGEVAMVSSKGHNIKATFFQIMWDSIKKPSIFLLNGNNCSMLVLGEKIGQREIGNKEICFISKGESNYLEVVNFNET
jgi:hypothetical protein